MDDSISIPIRQAVGSLIIEFSELESCVLHFIGKLLPIKDGLEGNDIAVRLAGGDPFGIMIFKLNKMFMRYTPNNTFVKKWNDLLEKLDSINRQRDRYIHSYWINVDEKTIRFKHKKNIGKNGTFTEGGKITEKEITQLVDEVHNITEELYSFMHTITTSISEQRETNEESQKGKTKET